MTRTIRKQTGNFLQDIRPGQIFRHKGGKTITEGLFTTFTEFAMTANPLAKKRVLLPFRVERPEERDRRAHASSSRLMTPR